MGLCLICLLPVGVSDTQRHRQIDISIIYIPFIRYTQLALCRCHFYLHNHVKGMSCALKDAFLHATVVASCYFYTYDLPVSFNEPGISLLLLKRCFYAQNCHLLLFFPQPRSCTIVCDFQKVYYAKIPRKVAAAEFLKCHKWHQQTHRIQTWLDQASQLFRCSAKQ